MERSTEICAFPVVRLSVIGLLQRGRDVSALPLPIFAAVLGFGLIGFGGYGPVRALLMAGGMVLACVFTSRPTFRLQFGILMGLATLGVGVLIVAGMHGWTKSAVPPVATLIIAAGSLFAVRGLVERGEREKVLRALTWSGGVVAISGLIGLAFHIEPWARLATGVWRISTTVGYANAAGAVLALSLAAALLLAVGSRGALDRGLLFVLATAAMLTLSRGALIALLVGAASGLALGAFPTIRTALPPFLGAGIAVVGAMPTVTGDTPQPGQMALGLVIGGIVAVARAPGLVRVLGTRMMHRVVIVGLLITLALTAFGVVTLAGDALDRFQESRLDIAGEGRLRNWTSQLSESLERPLLGHGFRTYLPSEANRFAHNEYLQAFHDGGAVGLVSVLVALATFAAAAIVSPVRRREPVIWAIAMSACIVFAVHSGVDFLWRYPVVVLLAFTWLAIAVSARVKEGEQRE